MAIEGSRRGNSNKEAIMIIIRNKIIPFKGFKAINIFGILFVRDAEIDKETK